MDSTEAFQTGTALLPELKEKASILGWCIEWVSRSYELVAWFH